MVTLQFIPLVFYFLDGIYFIFYLTSKLNNRPCPELMFVFVEKVLFEDKKAQLPAWTPKQIFLGSSLEIKAQLGFNKKHRF